MEINNITNPDYMLRKAMPRSETPSPELLTKIRYNAIRERPKARAYYHSRKLVAIIAAVVMLITLSTVALATNFFGIRNTALPSPEVGDNVFGIIVTEEMFDDSEGNWVIAQPFSMQGFEGSPEHSALVEWLEFIRQYDTDGALLEASGNTWGGVPEVYWYYGAYTMEMVEKIHEIADRHGLNLIGNMIDIRTSKELEMIVAEGPIITDDSIWFAGSAYECGTFWLEGQYGEYMFSFRHSRKGVFDVVFMTNRDNDFNEWIYENAHGTQLLLSQSVSGSTILLETETAFIVVNINAGTEGNPHDTYTNVTPFSRSDFENFADLIDFGQIRAEALDPAQIADVQTQIQAQREEQNEAVVSLVGRWNHIKSTTADGAELQVVLEKGLKVYYDRNVLVWYGVENAIESHEMGEFPRLISNEDSSWHIVFEATPDGTDEFKLTLLSSFTGANVPVSECFNFDSKLMYDSESGMLRYIDWNGNHHYFMRNA